MATAVAPANIAFIKYWGMRDQAHTLPYNSSLSMNLDACLATTSVRFDPQLEDDQVTLALYQQPPLPATGTARARVVAHLDRVRALAGVSTRAQVVSQNNFPADAGIASSAAGFAALTLAATAGLGLELSERALSRLARQSGSGSASRSIPTGFVEWHDGDDETSIAESIAPPLHWDLADVVAVVDMRAKKIGSAANHLLATSSPHFAVRLRELPARIEAVRQGILTRDLTLLGEATEADAVSMHVVCMTQQPPSFYWSSGTLEVIHAVRAWREDGLEAYFTIDAGPNVHVICAGRDRDTVQQRLEALPAVQFTLLNGVGPGAHLLAAAPPA